MKKTAALIVFFCLSGCSDFSLPPKAIVADGSFYYACGGNFVRTFADGLLRGGPYTIEFTDANGDWVQLRGVNKVMLTDIPLTIWSSLPQYLPDPKSDKDADGKPFEEGRVYSQSQTEQFILKDGKWERIRIPNPVCEKSVDR
jgi:hypothetical protein